MLERTILLAPDAVARRAAAYAADAEQRWMLRQSRSVRRATAAGRLVVARSQSEHGCCASPTTSASRSARSWKLLRERQRLGEQVALVLHAREHLVSVEDQQLRIARLDAVGTSSQVTGVDTVGRSFARGEDTFTVVLWLRSGSSRPAPCPRAASWAARHDHLGSLLLQQLGHCLGERLGVVVGHVGVVRAGRRPAGPSSPRSWRRLLGRAARTSLRASARPGSTRRSPPAARGRGRRRSCRPLGVGRRQRGVQLEVRQVGQPYERRARLRQE